MSNAQVVHDVLESARLVDDHMLMTPNNRREAAEALKASFAALQLVAAFRQEHYAELTRQCVKPETPGEQRAASQALFACSASLLEPLEPSEENARRRIRREVDAAIWRARPANGARAQ